MNLYAKLCEREAAGRPVTVGVIGADEGDFAVQTRRDMEAEFAPSQAAARTA